MPSALGVYILNTQLETLSWMHLHTWMHFFQGSGWKVVASFEGNFPNRIKQLPLDRHFDLKNVKRVWFPLNMVHLKYFRYSMMTVEFVSDCARSRWLPTLPHISRERIAVLNKRCIRAGKGAITSLCWWGKNADKLPTLLTVNFSHLISSVLHFLIPSSYWYDSIYLLALPYYLSFCAVWNFFHLLCICMIIYVYAI